MSAGSKLLSASNAATLQDREILHMYMYTHTEFERVYGKVVSPRRRGKKLEIHFENESENSSV